MYRKTYALIDEDILKKNIEEIKRKYNHYEYYIGVVKNNAYGHGTHIVNALIEGGINYLAVSSLEEAIHVRKYNQDIPILCLEVIDLDFISECIQNQVTITVESLDYLEKLNQIPLEDKVKVHLKLNTGMNRLGISDKEEVNQCTKILSKHKNIFLEGIYTHFATSGIADRFYDQQLSVFKALTSDIDLSKIPIVHLGRSLTLVSHDKIDFATGIRLGIAMYGFSQSRKEDTSWRGKLRKLKKQRLIRKYNISKTYLCNDLKLETAFRLYSHVMSIKTVKEKEFVGYGATYFADQDIRVAIIPIGYADGITKKYGYVSIHHKKYPIIADNMDMLIVKVDETVQVSDKVEIFGDTITILEAGKRNNCNSYHLLNMVTNRVPRVHKKGTQYTEIKY